MIFLLAVGVNVTAITNDPTCQAQTRDHQAKKRTLKRKYLGDEEDEEWTRNTH